MTTDQLKCIPSALLYETGADTLRDWLHARGWRLTLAELDTERARRRNQTKETRRHA